MLRRSCLGIGGGKAIIWVCQFHLVRLRQYGQDLVDIELALDGKSIVAFLVAHEQGIAHIFGQIKLFVVQFDAEEFPALAHLHVSVSSCHLFADI